MALRGLVRGGVESKELTKPDSWIDIHNRYFLFHFILIAPRSMTFSKNPDRRKQAKDAPIVFLFGQTQTT
jgi:hypothetical protein